jgi:hypothetical protein
VATVRVVPALDEVEHGDPADGLMLAHEPERFDGVDCVS